MAQHAHTEDAQTTHSTAGKQRRRRVKSEPVTGPDLPYLDYARIAIAHDVTNKHGRTLRPVLTGGALRVLLALVAATDDGGRVATGAGANVLFDSKTYYQHLAALERSGYLRKIVRSASERRHGEVTSAGVREAAKVGRLIERAARAFIRGATYTA